jgi:hypothetical protein
MMTLGINIRLQEVKHYIGSLVHWFISGLNLPCLMPEAKGEDNFYYWKCLENWGLQMFNSQQLTSLRIAHFKKIPGSLVEGSLKYTEELLCKTYMRTHCLNSNGSILNLENCSLLKEEWHEEEVWHEDLPTYQAGITMVFHHLSMNYLTNYKLLSYLFGILKTSTILICQTSSRLLQEVLSKASPFFVVQHGFCELWIAMAVKFHLNLDLDVVSSLSPTNKAILYISCKGQIHNKDWMRASTLAN